ncbi:MAG: Omp28 family outer membrane lipoprotein [Bacteroidota bacterium]
MKKFKIFILAVSAGFLIFQSCDKVTPPYKSGSSSNDTNTKVRKVLLEDYTGHKCPNCPAGAKTAHDLKTVYGEKLIILSVHAGFYSTPDATGDFTYDFRSAEGTAWDNFFGIGTLGNPNGMVNRKGYNTTHIIGPTGWGTAVSGIINNEPDAYIELTPTYNSGTRQLDVELDAEFLSILNGTYMISVVVTEDSIVKPQKNSDPNIGTTPTITNYVHRDVLRGSFNGTWGDTLVSGTTANGQHVVKNFSMILNSGWNENHISIVAFIYRKSDYEVIQAEERKAIP